MKRCDICGITEDKKPIINSKKAGKCLCNKHLGQFRRWGIRYRKDTGKYGIDFQYNNVRIYPMNLSKREEAVFVRYNLEKAIYDEYRRPDYDEKILREISLISPDRQLELLVYSNELINDFQRKLNEVGQ